MRNTDLVLINTASRETFQQNPPKLIQHMSHVRVIAKQETATQPRPLKELCGFGWIWSLVLHLILFSSAQLHTAFCYMCIMSNVTLKLKAVEPVEPVEPHIRWRGIEEAQNVENVENVETDL